MAKKEKLVITGNARESAQLRALRIDGSCNGQTLRTRVIRNKKLYNRNFKHKKSFADAGDFPRKRNVYPVWKCFFLKKGLVI